MTKDDKKKYVFVYGTLRDGASNPCTNYGGKFVTHARLPGAVMFDLGWFPGIKLDRSMNHEVVGDVFEVDTSIITSLDRYEGCRGNSPGDLYHRHEVKVEGFDEPVFTYEYNGYPDNRAQVDDGDWLNYLKEKRQ